MTDPNRQAAAKQAVALNSVFASGGMILAKGVVGLWTGSLGILGEAAHSLLDFAATILTYMAVKVSDLPPDDDHHFGHAKIEAVAALAATALLFLTGAWIAYEAIHRLATGAIDVHFSWWAVGVMVGSIVVDWWRARALSDVARATRSQALAADALHFSSDMVSSAVVLAGLGLVWLGFPAGDAIAALGVAVFVGLAGWRLGRRTVDTLIDKAPDGAADAIRHLAAEVPGVVSVDRVRVRPGGSVLFVDLDLSVGRTVPLDQVSAIKDLVTARIAIERPEAELTIRAQGIALDEETILDKVQVVAKNLNLAVHHVTIQHVGSRATREAAEQLMAISLDLEVDGAMSLGDAHDTATHLETAIRKELGGPLEIETHIEPSLVDEIDGRDATVEKRAALLRQIQNIANGRTKVHDVHDLRVRETHRGMYLTFHCRFEPTERVDDMHEAVSLLERQIKDQIPGIKRVIVHAEPAKAG